MPLTAVSYPDAVARGSAYGESATFKPVVGPEPRTEGTVSNEGIPAQPAVDQGAGQYTPLSAKQFESVNLAEGEGRLGFRRTEKLGESSRITITHSGIAFGRATGEGMTESKSSTGGRFNVQLPGGYYFRGAR